jgi:hypothetical protein
MERKHNKLTITRHLPPCAKHCFSDPDLGSRILKIALRKWTGIKKMSLERGQENKPAGQRREVNLERTAA